MVVDDDFGRIWKETLVAKFEMLFTIILEGLGWNIRNPTKITGYCGSCVPGACRSCELRVLHVVKICLFQPVVSAAPLADNRYHTNVCAPLRFQFSINHMVQNRLYYIGLKWNSFLRSFPISATLQHLQFHICWHIKKCRHTHLIWVVQNRT